MIIGFIFVLIYMLSFFLPYLYWICKYIRFMFEHIFTFNRIISYQMRWNHFIHNLYLFIQLVAQPNVWYCLLLLKRMNFIVTFHNAMDEWDIVFSIEISMKLYIVLAAMQNCNLQSVNSIYWSHCNAVKVRKLLSVPLTQNKHSAAF